MLYQQQQLVLRGIKQTTAEIEKKFPPAQFEYVGVGRSPAPFIAALDKEGSSTQQFPLSSFRPQNASPSITSDLLTDKPMTPEQTARLHAHFDEHIKPPARDKVLVLDYTQTAKSLIATQEQLQGYFNEKYPDRSIEVHALAIPTASHVGKVEANAAAIGENKGFLDRFRHGAERQQFNSRFHMIPLGRNIPLATQPEGTAEQLALGEALRAEAFDGLAPHGSAKMLEGEDPTPQGSDGYGVLKELVEIED